MPPHETTSVDVEACLPVCDHLTLPPHHKAPHHHHNRKRRKQRHHHHHHIKSLFYTLVAVVVACVLLLFSMMQRMTLDATLHDLMNAFVNADFIPHAVSKGIVELRIPESRAVQPIDIERQLLGTLFTQLVSRKRKLMMEIVKGAHVVVENDQGRFYELFRTISTSTYSRISSHFSNDVQYGVPQGYLLDTLLTGTTSGNDSWFQFEGANWDPIGRPVDSFIHCLNYIEYKIRGVQVGPLGTSMYTDQNPLRIPFDNSTETASRPDAMYRP